MDWIDINIRKPTEEQAVFFKFKDEKNETATEGTWELHRVCMLGPRNGACGEGFQDNYNKLPCDGDLWLPEEDYHLLMELQTPRVEDRVQLLKELNYKEGISYDRVGSLVFNLDKNGNDYRISVTLYKDCSFKVYIAYRFMEIFTETYFYYTTIEDMKNCLLDHYSKCK